MSAARNLSRVVQALGAIGLLTLLGAALVAFDAAAFHSLPFVARVPAGVAAAFIGAGLIRGAVVCVRSLRATRSARRGLRAARHAQIGGRRAVVLPDARIVACCVGLVRPVVVVSTGTIAALSEQQLEAVLAHEHAHARRHDPLRLLLAAIAAEVLGVLPGAGSLRRRYADLLEVAADHRAIEEVGHAPLAGAILAIADRPGCPHPSPDRVDGLLGRPLKIASSGLLRDGALLGCLGAAAVVTMSATGCFDIVGRAGVCGEPGGSAAAAAVMVLAAVGLAAGHAVRRASPKPLLIS